MRVELTSLGSRLYAHCSALGKVLLAYRPEADVKRIVKYGAQVDSIQSRRIGQ